MTRAVKAVSTYRGRDPRDFALVAFGGNGGVVAAQIAAELQMTHILVPPAPGVFSALGLLLSDAEQELTRTLMRAAAELAPRRSSGRMPSSSTTPASGCGPRAIRRPASCSPGTPTCAMRARPMS